MHINELMTLLPTRRVNAIDGMAVTADVWEEAHQHHRSMLRLHGLLNHGDGIVTGLEVIASDPPDNSIYILPGIASDPLGQTIVMAEPRAYDLGEGEGLFYLLLAFNESRPRYDSGKTGEDAPLFVFAEYSLEAVNVLPATAYVELARIRRHGKGVAITSAKDPAHPRRNELDLRFRKGIGVESSVTSALAVIYAGEVPGTQHALGLTNLARSLRAGGGQSVWVDRNVPIDSDLTLYTMIYLVGQNAFQLTTDQMTALYDFVQGGGTLFLESCRRDVRNQESPAEASFRELLASLGIQVEPVTMGHELLLEPNLFAQLPDGFETTAGTQLLAGDGVIVSSYDFGCLWAGERRDRLATRTEIRNALELGANFVAYAQRRRQLTPR